MPPWTPSDLRSDTRVLICRRRRRRGADAPLAPLGPSVRHQGADLPARAPAGSGCPPGPPSDLRSDTRVATGAALIRRPGVLWAVASPLFRGAGRAVFSLRIERQGEVPEPPFVVAS